MKQKNLIREAIENAIIAEAKKKEKNTHRECNKLINKIKSDIDSLAEKLEDMGIDRESKPYRQLHKMYEILTGFDPVQTKMVEYFKANTNVSAENMIQTEEDVKIPVDSDRETEKKAIDMSTKYNMDIELKNDTSQ